jgi:hypothetical protein
LLLPVAKKEEESFFLEPNPVVQTAGTETSALMVNKVVPCYFIKSGRAMLTHTNHQ